ncbi:MAG: glycoside hydrolase family 3 N-terminal domain-containing protein [Chloroflexota bacterium]
MSFRIVLILTLTLTLNLTSFASAQETNWGAQAETLLAGLDTAGRVGQLFLVTFQGSDAPPESEIADLIANYRVGGVVLLAQNDNFTGPDNTAAQAITLTNQLQQWALLGFAEQEGDSRPPQAAPPNPSAVPLLIATTHEGNGPPYTQILNGLTELPSAMALGATWQPPNAQTIGEIAGQELAAVGINLLLGPSLDVLENPSPSNPSDLGTRTFGGDPYWVGLFGRAYTAGVHLGSGNRVAVVAQHFPGYGSSDRPAQEEIATVRKSLEQLKQIELAPFFAVTGRANEPEGTTDGLLTSHIRYQGFQGNIRATTAPVSFDPQALSTLMQLPEFAPWREQGGVIVSDELGVRAVERFYDDTLQEFPHRRIAKDALLAGNDLLYLSDFALGDGDYQSHLANVKDTITWFQERYETDPTFQQRVDEAARRVIQLKLRLYNGDFSLSNVLADSTLVETMVGRQQGAVFGVAQAAITLIAPSPAELIERLPSPPDANDRIVIFTDVRNTRQCRDCPAQAAIGVGDLEQRMLALYGPSASGQVRPGQISSFTFGDLKAFLAAGPGPIFLPTAAPGTPTATSESEATSTPSPTPTPPPAFLVQEALSGADWIIFAKLGNGGSEGDSDALRLFLAQRPDIARTSRVVVFAYDAPYFLDTTEISKLTAYYGVYSHVGPFIDASVRALFQESPLAGAPPVSVAGIGYDLFTITQPDPNQVIGLFVVNDGVAESPPSAEPLEVVVGETLHLQTGIIRDRNDHPVPDGTVVQFIRQDRLEGFFNVIAERPTSGGVAQLDYLLEAVRGQFRITAAAGEAHVSDGVDIVVGDNVIVIRITPTPAPTSTATATATPTATSTPSPTPTLTPGPTTTPEASGPRRPATNGRWQMLLGLTLGLLLTSGVGWAFAANGRITLTRRVRLLLWGFMGALLAYNYLALGLPGSAWLTTLGGWAGLLATLLGGGVGLTIHWVVKHET